MPNLINSNDFDFEGFGISFLEVLANNGLPIVTKTQGINTSSLNGSSTLQLIAILQLIGLIK